MRRRAIVERAREAEEGEDVEQFVFSVVPSQVTELLIRIPNA